MKLVRGFGVNDADYIVCPTVNGKQVMCQAYMAWMNMLNRCYSEKLHASRPTYVGVTVCEEWKSFMAFRAWWLGNQVDGWELDKDLIGDGTVYSPESCIYVPGWLNTFTTDSGASRGDCPIGVRFHKQSGKYQARCSHPFGRHESIGLFSDKLVAGQAWMNRKLEIAEELKPKMDEIDARIYQRVVEIISRMQ
ncbi:MAG: hypothetical protein ACRCXB_28015 [Aeromonadaceae bacterium]